MFSICFKVYKNGRMSQGYLDRLQPGDIVQVACSRTKVMVVRRKVCLIAFGVGITECPVTIKRLLERGREEVEEILLIWCNRHEGETRLFETELASLLNSPLNGSDDDAGDGNATKKKKRFSIIHIITQRDGRLNQEKLKTIFSDRQWTSETTASLVIGSKNSMRGTYEVLVSLGFPHQWLLPGPLFYLFVTLLLILPPPHVRYICIVKNSVLCIYYYYYYYMAYVFVKKVNPKTPTFP